MTGNPFAGTARVGWMEFWSHLKSPRLIVLVVLFALLVFGVSYGLSSFSPGGGLGPSLSLAVYPAIRNESGTDHYLVIGWVADDRGVPRSGEIVSVYRQNLSVPSYGDQYGTFLGNLTTNTSGFVLYDTGTTLTESLLYGLRYGQYNFGTAGFYPGLENRTFTTGLLRSSSYSGPSGSASYFSLQALTLDGYPATAADVYLDGSFSGHPNDYGYFSAALPEGQHVVNISYEGYNETYMFSGNPPSGPVYENGADMVLMILVGTFMQLMLPIMAIAVSFDAIARERAQGSLEILLARRVRREGVLAGKFLGAFAALAIPVVAVLSVGILLVTVASGRAPTPSFAATALGAGLFLIAVYVLIMLLFSTLAKSIGTAVVFGVVTWLFFSVLFSFISTFALLATGGSYFDPNFYSTLLTIYLFNPNTLYQLILGAAVPTSGTGFGAGIVPTGYISISAIVIAAALWIAIPFVLTILVFRKKAES